MADEPSDIIREEMPLPPVSDTVWEMILDRNKMLETMLHILKGEVWVTQWDAGKEEMVGNWQQKGEALMNDKGIRFFSTFLYSAITPDKLMTRITEEEANDRCRAMAEEIILVITERGKEFDIKAANRGFLVRLMDDYYFMALSGSRRGTLLEALKPTYHREERYTPEPQKKKRFGLF
jgi:hypothetical protein